MAAKPKIVSAVATAAAADVSGRAGLAQRIEAAMAKAVTDAHARGVPLDSDEMRATVLRARESERAK